MKVILQKDVLNLGEAGDIKEVATGYARNFLLPNKLVISASASSQRAAEHHKRLIKIKKDKRKKTNEQMTQSLSGLERKITAQAGEEDKLFGSVTAIDIAKKLKEQGYDFDKRKISLETPIKKLGTYDVMLKLGEGATPVIKVTVERE